MQAKVITHLSGYFFLCFKRGKPLKRFKEDCQRARHPVVMAIHLQGKDSIVTSLKESTVDDPF